MDPSRFEHSLHSRARNNKILQITVPLPQLAVAIKMKAQVAFGCLVCNVMAASATASVAEAPAILEPAYRSGDSLGLTARSVGITSSRSFGTPLPLLGRHCGEYLDWWLC